MMQRVIRASAPAARWRVLGQPRAIVIPSSIRSADLVQDMYLKELKAYKPPPQKTSDAQGSVQTFKLPQSPKAPADTESLAEDLKAYDSQPVDAEISSPNASPIAGLPAKDEDWLEMQEDEVDMPAKASH